jgi:transcriptional regulator with XRE-family HTH domain
VENRNTWRALLGKLIQDSSERQRIAQALDINVITLSRWISGENANPRLPLLRQLLQVIPYQHRELMQELLLQEFPALTSSLKIVKQSAEENEIPSEFYTRIFKAFAVTPPLQRSWSIQSLILQQALGQLDPDHVGMAVTIVQCMPPSHNGLVCSLRERAGYGTPPWSVNLEPYAVFLGAESLAGYVVGSGHPRIIQNSKLQQGVLPAHWFAWEKSAAAYPILRANGIAGCLLVSCTQANHFSPARQRLLQNYAELLSIVFEKHEFYDQKLINLRAMPYYRVQEQYLANFRQRVSEVMMQELRNGHSIEIRQAEQLILQQVEEELWHLPAYSGSDEEG